MTDPLQFAFAVLLLLAVPGPTNTLVALAGAINRGERPWSFVVASVGGYLAVVLACRTLLLPLIDVYPQAGIAIKLAVVAYLIYAAVRLWAMRAAATGRPQRITVPLVFTTTVLNPKGLVFALVIIPRDPPLSIYHLAFALMALCVALAWFMAGRALAVVSGRRAALLPRLGALVLVGFAGYLAVTAAS